MLDRLALLPAVLAVLSFGLSLVSSSYCQYVSVDWLNSNSANGGNFIPQKYGIWNYQGRVYSQELGQYRTECLAYKSQIGNSGGFSQPFPLDSKWRTAMAFAVIASVFGGVVVVWIILAQCISTGRWRILSRACFFLALCEGLTLVFLSSSVCKAQTIQGVQGLLLSSTGCTRSYGANSSIVSTIFWIVTGIAMIFISPPQFNRDPEIMHHTVTYTETAQPDGTKVITEHTTIVKGNVVNDPASPAAPEQSGEAV